MVGSCQIAAQQGFLISTERRMRALHLFVYRTPLSLARIYPEQHHMMTMPMMRWCAMFIMRSASIRPLPPGKGIWALPPILSQPQNIPHKFQKYDPRSIFTFKRSCRLFHLFWCSDALILLMCRSCWFPDLADELILLTDATESRSGSAGGPFWSILL